MLRGKEGRNWIVILRQRLLLTVEFPSRPMRLTLHFSAKWRVCGRGRLHGFALERERERERDGLMIGVWGAIDFDWPSTAASAFSSTRARDAKLALAASSTCRLSLFCLFFYDDGAARSSGEVQFSHQFASGKRRGRRRVRERERLR